jgi:hydroxyethylthiazole kinase-like uncharacterized protein yjeF
MTRYQVTEASLRAWPLPRAGRDKHDRGSVLVIGGAARTPGAALLAGLAALRAGAGQLRLAVAESAASAIAVAVPEALILPLAQESSNGSIRDDAINDHLGELADVDAVCVGPGLDDADATVPMLTSLLSHLRPGTACVIDAFALSAVPKSRELVKSASSRILLTPNLSEAVILLGGDPSKRSIAAGDIPAAARRIAGMYGVTVSLHGCTADAGGDEWIDDREEPGLGTSGSGDVLAGVAAGVLARGAPPAQAGVLASYVHLSSGRRLANRVGPLGYLARELLDEIPGVLAALPLAPP